MKNSKKKLFLVGIILFSLGILFGISSQDSSSLDEGLINFPLKNDETILMTNKKIPEEIRKQAMKALSFYPELRDQPIEFKFKKNIKKSTMQAQPRFSGVFKKKGNRGYIILISKKFQIEDDSFSILDVEDKVLIGWLGHELGHIMDYKNRSSLGMIWLGAKYLLSAKYIQKVERQADTYAVLHGMGEYILATKNFILRRSGITEKYRDRIKRLYLSPEEIMQLVNGLEPDEVEEKIDEQLEDPEVL